MSEYIDQCRAVKAKELLVSEALKIRDVAMYVGYEAHHSFTRFFKNDGNDPPGIQGVYACKSIICQSINYNL
ncbi:helix-turn-helix domain-containing protein [Paenibacillus rhizoplanae]